MKKRRPKLKFRPQRYAHLYFNFFNSDTNPSTSGNDLVLDDINVDIRVKATVSGNVFTDGNGDRLLNGTDQPFNGVAAPLFAYVTDVNGRVIAKVQVGADGTYVFTNQPLDSQLH